VEGIHRRCHDVLIHSLRLTVELAVAIITGASESRATTRWLPVTTGWLPRSHPLKVAPHKGFSRSSDYGDYGDYRGEISSCIQPMQQGTATRARWRIPAALTRTRLRYCTGDPPAAMAPSVVGDYRWLRGDYRVVTRSNPLHIRLSADRVTTVTTVTTKWEISPRVGWSSSQTTAMRTIDPCRTPLWGNFLRAPATQLPAAKSMPT